MKQPTKQYVLDTNVLVSDPKAIYKFHEHIVVIPIIVIEELDNLKTRQDDVGRHARHAIREIESLRADNPVKFREGVKLATGGQFKIELNHVDLHALPIPSFQGETNDNRILATAYALRNSSSDPVILVSKDANLRIKASAVGIEAEEYKNEKVEIDELYTGQITLEVSSKTIDKFYADKALALTGRDFKDYPIYANELIILTAGKQSAVGRAHLDGEGLIMRPFNKHAFGYQIKPKNVEQEFALNLMMDPTIDLVTMAGSAGTGKTLLTLLAGMELVVRAGAFSRLLVARPLVPMGQDIGYLPGNIDEKMSVWMKPFKDNLEHLMEPDGRNPYDIDNLFEEGIIEVGVLSYIRGRSIPNQFIIIDECQNLERHDIRSVLTRVGEHSKACLTGDLSQIDHPLLDTVTNGLTHVIENLKGEPTFGHITLTKGVRSHLATMIAERL